MVSLITDPAVVRVKVMLMGRLAGLGGAGIVALRQEQVLMTAQAAPEWTHASHREGLRQTLDPYIGSLVPSMGLTLQGPVSQESTQQQTISRQSDGKAIRTITRLRKVRKWTMMTAMVVTTIE